MYRTISDKHLAFRINHIALESIDRAVTCGVWDSAESYIDRSWIVEEESQQEYFLSSLFPSLNLFSASIIIAKMTLYDFIMKPIDEKIIDLPWINPELLRQTQIGMSFDFSPRWKSINKNGNSRTLAISNTHAENGQTKCISLYFCFVYLFIFFLIF